MLQISIKAFPIKRGFLASPIDPLKDQSFGHIMVSLNSSAIATDIRRFLQHVRPAGVHKVRYYGLWSASNRKKLSGVQQILIQPENNQQEGFKEDMDVEAPPP